MAHYLLTSEEFVKTATPISMNIAGKYILDALLDAQEVKMRSIIGGELLDALKEKAKAKAIAGDKLYKGLLDRMQMALAWLAVVKLTRDVSYKVTNKGVVKTYDENVSNASLNEVIIKGADAQASADYYVAEVQRYLRANREAFPELNGCANINLTSSASSGLWLGGIRGQKL